MSLHCDLKCPSCLIYRFRVLFLFLKLRKGNSFCTLSLHGSPSVLGRDVTRRRCQDRMVSAPALLNWLNAGMLAPPSKWNGRIMADDPLTCPLPSPSGPGCPLSVCSDHIFRHNIFWCFRCGNPVHTAVIWLHNEVSNRKWLFFSRQRSSPVTMVRLFYSSRAGGKL